MKFLPWFTHTASGDRTAWQPVAPPSHPHHWSGTSRFANHNTVGTAFALPSLPCTQKLFQFFLSSFLIICLFWFFLFFFRMEILRSIGVACSGRTVTSTKRVEWGMGRGLETDSEKSRGKFSFLSSNEGSSKQLPCVPYFSWGSMANGARRDLAKAF